MFEYSVDALVAGNISTDNESGVQAGESSNVRIWNNTLVNNVMSVNAYDGFRGPVPTGITVRNNILSAGSSSKRPMVLVFDAANVRTWQNMRWSSDYNAFYRTSTVTTTYVANLAGGSAGSNLFRTLPAVVQGTGLEAHSATMSTPPSPGGAGNGTALTAEVAFAFGQPAGAVIARGAP
jgi:hypothetical protein